MHSKDTAYWRIKLRVSKSARGRKSPSTRDRELSSATTHEGICVEARAGAGRCGEASCKNTWSPFRGTYIQMFGAFSQTQRSLRAIRPFSLLCAPSGGCSCNVNVRMSTSCLPCPSPSCSFNVCTSLHSSLSPSCRLYNFLCRTFHSLISFTCLPWPLRHASTRKAGLPLYHQQMFLLSSRLSVPSGLWC